MSIPNKPGIYPAILNYEAEEMIITTIDQEVEVDEDVELPDGRIVPVKVKKTGKRKIREFQKKIVSENWLIMVKSAIDIKILHVGPARYGRDWAQLNDELLADLENKGLVVGKEISFNLSE